MTLKDWITSPQEWSEWGTRANAWFNDLVSAVRALQDSHVYEDGVTKTAYWRGPITLSASGEATIFAADVGLTTVEGAVAEIQWSADSRSGWMGTCRIAGGGTLLQLRGWALSGTSSGTVTKLTSVSPTYSIVAWGT